MALLRILLLPIGREPLFPGRRTRGPGPFSRGSALVGPTRCLGQREVRWGKRFKTAAGKKVLALKHFRGDGNRDNPLTDDALFGGEDGPAG